jgi:hypothetical protein
MKVSTTSAGLRVALGFEVGSGDLVGIPVRNMCVAGQTQESGKTTTLEALITRAGMRAVTFVTKRGESAFRASRRVAPYFREQTDWQFVASVLEASRGERLKFERPWIIRASKGARTLADVQRNVRAALNDPKVRGWRPTCIWCSTRTSTSSCQRSRRSPGRRGWTYSRGSTRSTSRISHQSSSTWSSSPRSNGCSRTRRTRSSSCRRRGSLSRRGAARR